MTGKFSDFNWSYERLCAYAYIEESGNTGLNLFDPAQPNFLHVAMTSPVDFDDVFKGRVDNIARTAGVDYLHASEMGQELVEAVAYEVLELVQFSQVRFHFAYIVKPDAAVAKFYDAIFDPGENPAAPIIGYNSRLLRLGLFLQFATLVTPDDAALFWRAMTSTRSPEVEMQAVEAIDNVLQRTHTLADTRSRQLIEDTLQWSRENIGHFSFWTSTRSERYGQLPNLFTLPMLFSGIYEAARTWNDRVTKIIHDQQSQFGRTLQDWHSFLEGLNSEPIHLFGDTSIRFADIRGSEFQLAESRSSPGLQVVDFVLWTFSRLITQRPIGPEATELFNLCFSTDSFSYLSLDLLSEEVRYLTTALYNQPINEEQLSLGKQFVEQSEEKRQERIRTFRAQ